jgi:nucleoside-diphosphate-sugar epimerase
LGVRRVVLLGSAEEYGAQDGPLREDMPLRPLTFYGITKAAATSLALAMHAAGGCPAVILRPFTVYGPGQPKDMFVAEAVEAAVAGEPFRMSQGEQRRDFIYVQDLVEALLASALAPGLEGHVVNVGTGRARRLRDVAERIWQLTGSTAPLLVGARPASPHQLHDTWADTSAARRLLGWQPRVELDQGLAEAIEWCRMSRRSLGAGLVR